MADTTPIRPRIHIGPENFDVSDELALLQQNRTDIGGIGSFIGTVRGSAGGRPITAMTLEHYPGMTERALATIATAAASRWPLLACTLIHRVGLLRPGDNIVLVLAASPHRQAALDATHFLIDWLKTSAPFWKNETFPDGTTAWVDARDTDTEAAARWGALAGAGK